MKDFDERAWFLGSEIWGYEFTSHFDAYWCILHCRAHGAEDYSTQRVLVSSVTSWRWFETMQVGRMGLSSVPELAIYFYPMQGSLGLCPALRFKHGGRTTSYFSSGNVARTYSAAAKGSSNCRYLSYILWFPLWWRLRVYGSLICGLDYFIVCRT